MKTETLQTLITARTLLDKAGELCLAEDKYLSSAGLVILQDGLELVLYACLLELGVDEEKSLEKLSFDDLISEIRKQGKKIIKSGTLKALNRERVNIKHFGHLAEPATVKTFYKAATLSIEQLLQSVVNKGLQEIMLHELLNPGEARDCIQEACRALEEMEYYQALLSIRKAIYVDIEKNYSIEKWQDYDPNSQEGFMGAIRRGGLDAPWHTRNADWISKNVNKPFDYIQIDHEKMNVTLMEWGVSTEDFWNIHRLTPQVFRNADSTEWLVLGELHYLHKAATEDNVRYCLDRAISILLSKQLHSARVRTIENRFELDFEVKANVPQPVYRKTSINSEVVGALEQGKVYRATAHMPGFDRKTWFFQITHIEREPKLLLFGYTCAEGVTPIERN